MQLFQIYLSLPKALRESYCKAMNAKKKKKWTKSKKCIYIYKNINRGV